MHPKAGFKLLVELGVDALLSPRVNSGFGVWWEISVTDFELSGVFRRTYCA